MWYGYGQLTTQQTCLRSLRLITFYQHRQFLPLIKHFKAPASSQQDEMSNLIDYVCLKVSRIILCLLSARGGMVGSTMAYNAYLVLYSNS